MEKCDKNVRNELKNENCDLEERKKIAIGLKNGFEYLMEVGIEHFDKKLENFLLLGGVVKICDFGLVSEWTGRRSYRQMGYCRRGSKFRYEWALCKFLKLRIVLFFVKVSGSPGFSNQAGLQISTVF